MFSSGFGIRLHEARNRFTTVNVVSLLLREPEQTAIKSGQEESCQEKFVFATIQNRIFNPITTIFPTLKLVRLCNNHGFQPSQNARTT